MDISLSSLPLSHEGNSQTAVIVTVVRVTGASGHWRSEVSSRIDPQGRPAHPCQQWVPQVLTGCLAPPPTPSRRDSDHQREVQQLYEEMEQQIQWEKQQLQAEVPLPSPSPIPLLGWGWGRGREPRLASVGQSWGSSERWGWGE